MSKGWISIPLDQLAFALQLANLETAPPTVVELPGDTGPVLIDTDDVIAIVLQLEHAFEEAFAA